MKRAFEIRLVSGYTTVMNNVNEVAQFVKNVLLTTNYVVKVNGFEFRVYRTGVDGYVLEVGTSDDGKAYVYQRYVLGKIRRGIDKYVENFLVLNTEFGEYKTPKFVWEDGKLVYIKTEVQNVADEVVEENDEMLDMENHVLGAYGFNEYMEGKLVEDFEIELDATKECAEIYGDTENEHYLSWFYYEYDIEQEWIDFADSFGISADVAYKFYRENREIFIDEDDLNQWVYGFEDTYGVGIDDNCCGSCMVWVKNPNYVAEDAPKNDAPCLNNVA